MCPVALYSATTRAHDVNFHLLHKRTKNRVHMLPHDPEIGEVERRDLVRGFEVARNKYVVLDKRDFDQVRLPTTRTIAIEEFVESDEIDRIYWNDPYYLVPDGDEGMDAYVVIRQAMEKTGKMALGRVVMHTRERIVAVEPRDRGMLLTTLRSYDEIVDPDALFRPIKSVRTGARMLDVAERIVDQQTAAFDPTEFTDRYEDALRDLIAQKQKGQKIVETAPPEEEPKVINLMDALRRSLEAQQAAQGRGTPTREPRRARR